MSAVVRVHRIPAAARRLAERPVLHISGLVDRPLELAPEDLASLPRLDLRESLTCDPTRAAAGQTWRGVRILEVARLARPLPIARFVRVSSGGFVIPLDLAEAGSALLADTLNNEPLSIERGAPWRLVVPGGRCFTSVKWVNQLELAAEPGRDSGERLERARERRQAIGQI